MLCLFCLEYALKMLLKKLISLGKVMGTMGTVRNQYEWCQFSPRMWREGSYLHRIILLTCMNVLGKLISVLKHLRKAGEQAILTLFYSWVNSLRWASEWWAGTRTQVFSVISIVVVPRRTLWAVVIVQMSEWVEMLHISFLQSVLYRTSVLCGNLWKSSWTNKLGNVILW